MEEVNLVFALLALLVLSLTVDTHPAEENWPEEWEEEDKWD